jgi:hypothetical protein
MESLEYIVSEGTHPKKRKRMHERLRIGTRRMWEACEKGKSRVSLEWAHECMMKLSE